MPEKAFREQYIAEYIKDFSVVNALVRCGITDPQQIKNYSGALEHEPYVQRRLHEIIQSIPIEAICTRNQVMAGLWKEANLTTNDPFVRVAALSQCAKMLGMDKPHLDRDETETRTVMLIPVIAIDEWSQTAQVAQAALKAKAANAFEVDPTPTSINAVLEVVK